MEQTAKDFEEEGVDRSEKQQESHRGKGIEEETEINTQCIPLKNLIRTLGFILKKKTMSFKKITRTAREIPAEQ